MPVLEGVLGCLGVLLLLGALERLARDRARRAVLIRIHVNGTRGKSTVTRLIWGALREAGIPTVAKTTGTAARLLLPDGSEQPVRRRAPASIREQMWVLRRAHRAGARALVAECMAIRPELQAVSERDMLASTIGVITNVRSDHTDAMGDTLEEIAASLSSTTPRNGVLVVGGSALVPAIERRTRQAGTRLIVVPDEPPPAAAPASGGTAGGSSPSGLRWQEQNRALTLAVTRELGIADEVALRGMAAARPDPGAVRSGTLNLGGRTVPFVDATAANDPESLDLLAADVDTAGLAVVYNHRADRPDRLRCFAAQSRTVRQAAFLAVAGDRPSLTLWRTLRSCRGTLPLRRVSSKALPGALAQLAAEPGSVKSVLFCGNTKGFNRGAASLWLNSPSASASR